MIGLPSRYIWILTVFLGAVSDNVYCQGVSSPSSRCTDLYNHALNNFDDLTYNEISHKYADSALFLANKYDLILLQVRIHILLGKIHTHRLTKYEGWMPENINKPKYHFDKALELAKTTKDVALISEIYSNAIYYYFRTNDYDIAASLAQKHIRLIETNQLLDETPYALLALIYGKQGNTTIAMEYFNKNTDMLIKMDKEHMVSGVMSDIGNMYFAMGNYDSARYYYMQGLDIAKKFDDLTRMSFIKDNIGLTHFKQNKNKEAIEWLLEALDHRRSVNWLEGMMVTMHHLAGAYLAHGLPSASKAILIEAFELSGQNDNLFYSDQTLELLAQTFEALGQFDSANYYLKLAYQNQNQMWKRDTERAVRASLGNIQLEKENLKNELVAAEYQNMLITALAILLLIAVVAGLYMYRSRKNKLLQQLALAKLAIEKEKVARIEAEKAQNDEISRLREVEMQSNISSLNRELLGYSHIIAQKNEALNQILLQIKQTSELHDGQLTAQEVNKLNKAIKEKLTDENNWLQFITNFNSINPEFFKRLKNAHPELTTNDMRLCIYMMMSLSSEEIANIMHISMESLRNSRLRLRHKMGLDGKTDIEKYVRSIIDNTQVA